MSSDNVLSPFTSKLAPPATTPPERSDVEAEPAEDFGAFGWLRGVRERALMLELRMKDGRIIAQGYAWLERAEFDPADTITLTFTSKTIKIIGRNLNKELRPLVRLFDGLLRHRVPWIVEAAHPSVVRADPRAVIVERIECE